MGNYCCHVERHPVYYEDEPSYLCHNSHYYSVNVLIELSRLKQVIKMPLSRLDIMPLSELDEERVKRADYAIPIIVLENDHVILDGMHRAAHALLDRQQRIPARIVTHAELAQARI